MFWRILGRELKRKKGINFILFLFVILATVFVAASVNNILVVRNATDYCMEKGNVPDDSVWVYEPDSVKELDQWLEDKGRDYYTSYTIDSAVALAQGNIASFNGKKGSDYVIKNSIIMQPNYDSMTAYCQDGSRAVIEPGYIAMQKNEMEANDLEAGDTITIKVNDYEKEFILTESVMDPCFGGDFIGETRYFVNDGDYEDIVQASGVCVYLYNINSEDMDELSAQINRMGISIVVEISRDMFELTYVMSLVTSGIITIVGVCLIIIAFLILRFTISVTLQEDYREIGIMKAIGIRDRGIRGIYLVKYLALSLAGVIIGCALSIPANGAMLKMVAGNMMMESSDAHMIINILCSLAVLLIILLFCYGTTGKLKKYSAIDAIRNGSKGEGFKKTSKLSLYKKKSCHTTVYMAVNDILSGFKRYVAMILTFAIGIILVILCCNTITTFKSDEMAKNFMLDTNAQAYINPDMVYDSSMFSMTESDVVAYTEDLEKEFADKGHDAYIHTSVLLSASLYTEDDPLDMRNYLAIQPVNSDGSYIQMSEGDRPRLANEIVLSGKIMDKYGLEIGDSVHLVLNATDYNMIISGSYQNYMQMGQTILLSSALDMTNSMTKGGWYYQVCLNNDNDTIDKLRDDFPEYEILDTDGVMNKNLGNVMSQIGIIKLAVLILICAVNVLITVLMLKIFIMAERGQIAMMRSVGFSVGAVRIHQIIRMGIVFLVGAVLGIGLSVPLNTIALKPIFGMMGATTLKIQINPLETYVLYPLILMAVVILSTAAASLSIRKMKLMEINNIE